jgi:PEP-CTERM/exosortase A-associated glycosyltransferase
VTSPLANDVGSAIDATVPGACSKSAHGVEADGTCGVHDGRSIDLLVFTSLYPNKVQPAHGVFVEERLRHLVASGRVSATVVAPVPWFPFRHRAFGAYATFAAVPREETRHGIRVLHPRYPVIPKLGMNFTPSLMYRALLPAVRKLAAGSGNFDLIDAHYFYPDGVVAARLGAAIGKPVVISARGSDVTWIPRYRRPRLRIQAAAESADALVTVSQALKDTLAALGADPAKITVLRNGVDLDRFAPRDRMALRRKIGVQGAVWLTVSHLVELKGIHIVIEALARVPDVTLLIAGKGPQERELSQLVDRLGLSARVRFLGAIPHAELCDCYNVADAMVLASSREGMPNVVLESIACGTPVLATPVGGIPELITVPEAGELMRERSPEALAKAWNILRTRQPDRTATRQFAQTLGWRPVVEAQCALYARVLGGGSPDDRIDDMNDTSAAAARPASGSKPADRPLRILHVLDHSLPLHSGYTFRTLAILNQQRALGWETFQLTGPKQGSGQQREEVVDGWMFHRTPPATGLAAKLPVVQFRALMKALQRRLAEVVTEVRPDIIHAHSPVLNAFPALAVGHATGIPVVYEVRAFWEDAAVDQGTASEWGARYRLTRAMETRALRQANAVTTICEGLRGDMLERGIPAEKITVIPNAVDLSRFQFTATADAEIMQKYGLARGTTLGFAGSFYAYEGLDLLLRAMPEVLRAVPQARLLLLGGGPQEAALKTLATELHLEGAVHFTGRVPQGEMTRYYSAMDVMVYPRTSMRLTDLVTPLKPLEAMAMGKLVVASDVGGHRELIRDGENGHLFPAGSHEALARRLVELLQTPKSWGEIISNGRAYVENERNWETSVGRYPAVYSGVLARHRPGARDIR